MICKPWVGVTEVGNGAFSFDSLPFGTYTIRSMNDTLGFEYHNIIVTPQEPIYDVGEVTYYPVVQES